MSTAARTPSATSRSEAHGAPPATAYWDRARSILGVADGGPVNIASLIVDRHVAEGRGDDIAITVVSKDPDASETNLTYRELSEQSGRFATVLRELGLQPGERVFLLAGRVPLLYVAALGTWKAGGVVCPLFAAFGPEPVRQRLELGDARILITTAANHRRKIAALREQLPSLTHVLIVDDAGDAAPPDTTSIAALLAATTEQSEVVATTADDPALIHFTSGTTGTPKAAVHVHEAVVAHMATADDVFGLGRDDVYWCTADPGWVTGTSYGIIAPMAAGARMIVDEGELEPERWYRLLERHRVSVWYTAPTAVRMLMRAGTEVARRHDLSALRVVASVGEPLDPESVRWGSAAFDRRIRDTWWQTETGAIMIANNHLERAEPGSMGRAIGGVSVGLLECSDTGELVRRDGRVVELDEPDKVGMIAIRPGWPSMFRDYLHAPERYAAAFVDGWYLSGDLAHRDAAGWYWFVGRADDVIKTAGHLIGPFEVESVLNEHPDVVGAGVYGLPDDVAGELIHAEIVLRRGVDASDATMTDVMAHARRRLGAALAPRSIRAVPELPYTRSGKVMRRLLRARALGLPEGDTSTLETGAST